MSQQEQVSSKLTKTAVVMMLIPIVISVIAARGIGGDL
jgi:hypothetical protein